MGVITKGKEEQGQIEVIKRMRMKEDKENEELEKGEIKVIKKMKKEEEPEEVGVMRMKMGEWMEVMKAEE